MSHERRFAVGSVELRAVDADAAPIAEGYAAVFGRRSLDLGGFTEVIDPAAFTKTVREADVVALWNHDDNALLGRVTSGTLRLSIDEHGLRYDVDLPDTSAGRDLLALLKRKDVRGSSFGFRTIRDKWDQDEDGLITRTLLEVALIDVSPVARPAYPDTDAALRSLASATQHDLSAVRAAFVAHDLRQLLTPAESGAEEPTIDGEAPAEPSIKWIYA